MKIYFLSSFFVFFASFVFVSSAFSAVTVTDEGGYLKVVDGDDIYNVVVDEENRYVVIGSDGESTVSQGNDVPIGDTVISVDSNNNAVVNDAEGNQLGYIRSDPSGVVTVQDSGGYPRFYTPETIADYDSIPDDAEINVIDEGGTLLITDGDAVHTLSPNGEGGYLLTDNEGNVRNIAEGEDINVGNVNIVSGDDGVIVNDTDGNPLGGINVSDSGVVTVQDATGALNHYGTGNNVIGDISSSSCGSLSGEGLSAIANNIMCSVRDTPGLVSVLSYLASLLMGVLGIVKMKEYVENPERESLLKVFVIFVCAGLFLATPLLYEAMSNTISGGTELSDFEVKPRKLYSSSFGGS